MPSVTDKIIELQSQINKFAHLREIQEHVDLAMQNCMAHKELSGVGAKLKICALELKEILGEMSK